MPDLEYFEPQYNNSTEIEWSNYSLDGVEEIVIQRLKPNHWVLGDFLEKSGDVSTA